MYVFKLYIYISKCHGAPFVNYFICKAFLLQWHERGIKLATSNLLLFCKVLSILCLVVCNLPENQTIYQVILKLLYKLVGTIQRSLFWKAVAIFT